MKKKNRRIWFEIEQHKNEAQYYSLVCKNAGYPSYMKQYKALTATNNFFFIAEYARKGKND